MAGGLLHEIRNPLAAMTVYLDVLRGRAGDAETREILERTLGEAERLNGFLADFQVFAGGKPLRRESVAADAVVDAAARAVRFPAPVRLVRALAADAAFDADRPLLVHAIRNLLQNAVDAMAGAAGEIRISAERAGPDVVLSVGDDGPGIPAEQRERVLEPMFTTRPGGIGLGLTIVERVVQAHGGTLELDVSPAGGALFRMRLPAAPEEAAR
jgi:two-component system sensor histidine kinase HydH